MPGVDNENLKKYIIDVDVNIKQAEEKLATLQSTLDEGVKSGKIKKDTKATVSDVASQFEKLEKEVKASISGIENSIKNGFKGINTKEVAAQFEILSDQINGFQGQIETLQNVLNKSDTSKFEKAITKMISPFSKLDDTVKEMRQTLQSLVEPIQTISSVMASGINVSTKEIGKATQETAKAVKKANKEVVAVSEETAAEIKSVYKKQLADIAKPITDVLTRDKGKTFTQFVNNISKSSDKTKIEKLSRLLSELHEQINIIREDAESKGIAVNVSNLFKGTPFTEANIQKAQDKLNKALSRSLVKSTSPKHKISAAVNIEGTIDDANIDKLVNQIRDEVINKIAEKLAKSDDNRTKIKIPMRIDSVGLKGEVDAAIKKVNQELRSANSQYHVDIPIKPFISPQNLEKVGGEIQEQILGEGGLNLNSNNVLKLGDTGNLATEQTVEDIRNILQGMLGKAVIKTASGEIIAGRGTQVTTSGTSEKEPILSQGFKDYLYNLRRNVNSTYAKRFGALEDTGSIREVAKQAKNDYKKLFDSIRAKFLNDKDVNPVEYLKKLEIYKATQGPEDNLEKYAKFGEGKTTEEFRASLEKNTIELVDGIEKSLNETKKKFNSLKNSGLTDEVKNIAIDELNKQRKEALHNNKLQDFINQNEKEITAKLKERNAEDKAQIDLLNSELDQLGTPLLEIAKNQGISVSDLKNRILLKNRDKDNIIYNYDYEIAKREDILKSGKITDKSEIENIKNQIKDFNKSRERYIKEIVSSEISLSNNIETTKSLLNKSKTEKRREVIQKRLDELTAERQAMFVGMSESDLEMFNQIKEFEQKTSKARESIEQLQHNLSNRTKNSVASDMISAEFNEKRKAVNESSTINETISHLLSDALARESKQIVDGAINDAGNILNTEKKRQQSRIKLAEDIAHYGKDAVIGKTTEEQYKRDFDKMKTNDVLPYLLNAERLDDIDFEKLGKKFEEENQFVAEVGEKLPSVVKETLDSIKAEGQGKLDKLASNVEDLTKEKEILEKIVQLRSEDKDNTEEIAKLVASEAFQLGNIEKYQKDENGKVLEGKRKTDVSTNERLDAYIKNRLPEVNKFLDEADNLQKSIYGQYNNLQRRFAESIYNPISWSKQYKAKVKEYNANTEELRYLNQFNKSDLTPYEKERLGKLQKSIPILRAQLTAYEEINKDEEDVQEETKRRIELTKNTKYANRSFTKAGNQAAIRLSDIKGKSYSFDEEQSKIDRFKNLSDEDLSERIKDSDFVIKELDKEYSKVKDSIDKAVDKNLKELIKGRIKYLEERKAELTSKIEKNKKYVEDNGGEYKSGKLDNEVQRIEKSLTALKNDENISIKNITKKQEELEAINKEISDWEDTMRKSWGITDESQFKQLISLRNLQYNKHASKQGNKLAGSTSKKLYDELSNAIADNSLNIDTRPKDIIQLVNQNESISNFLSETIEDFDKSVNEITDKTIKTAIKAKINDLKSTKESLLKEINQKKDDYIKQGKIYRKGTKDRELDDIQASIDELEKAEKEINIWETNSSQYGIKSAEQYNALREVVHKINAENKKQQGIKFLLRKFAKDNNLSIDPQKIMDQEDNVFKYFSNLNRRDELQSDLERLSYLTDEKGNGISYKEKAKQSVIKQVTKEKEELEKERNIQLEINSALKEEQVRRANVQKQVAETAKVRKAESKMDIDAEIAKSEQSYEAEKKSIQNKYGKASTLKGKITKTENTIEKLQKQYDETEKEIDNKYSKLFEAVNKKIEKARKYKDPNLTNIETALRKRQTTLKNTTDENERKKLEEDIQRISQDRDILRYKNSQTQKKLGTTAAAENQALKQQLAAEKEERLGEIEKQLNVKKNELNQLKDQENDINSEIRALDKQHKEELANLDAIRDRNFESLDVSKKIAIVEKQIAETKNESDKRALQKKLDKYNEEKESLSSSNEVKAKAVKLSEDEAAQKRLATIEAEKQTEEAFEQLSLKEKILYLEREIEKTTNLEAKEKLNNKLLRYSRELVGQLNAEEYKERMAENAPEVEIPKRKKRTIKTTSTEESKEIKEGETTTLQVKPIEDFEPGALATEATLREILNIIKGKPIKGGSGNDDDNELISKEEFDALKQAFGSQMEELQNVAETLVKNKLAQQQKNTENKKEADSAKDTAKVVEGAEKKKQSAKKNTQKESQKLQQEEKKENEIVKDSAKNLKQFDWKAYQDKFKSNINKLYDLDSKGKISHDDANSKLIRNIFNGMFSLNNQGGTLTYDSITKNIKNTSNKQYIKEIYEQVAAWRELCKAGEEWAKVSKEVKDAAKRSQSGKASKEDYQLLYDNGYTFRKNKYNTYSAIQTTTKHNEDYLELMQGREAIASMLKNEKDLQNAKKSTQKVSKDSQNAEKKEGNAAKETAKKVKDAEEKKQEAKKETQAVSKQSQTEEKKEGQAATESAAKTEKAENSKQKAKKKITIVQKYTSSKENEGLDKVALADILKRYSEMDNAIAKKTNSFSEILERQFSWVSKTGYHSSFRHQGEHDKVTPNIIRGADSSLHTHPDDYVSISSNEGGKGDLRSFYSRWLGGIKNQFIRGLKQTLYFDADQFFSDLKGHFESQGVKFDNAEFEKINAEWREIKSETLSKHLNYEDFTSKIELSKESFLEFIDQIASDSDLLTKIFGDKINDKSILEDIKSNVSKIDKPINSIGEYFKEIFSKDALGSLYKSKDSLSKTMSEFARNLVTLGKTNGFGKNASDYTTQYRRLTGKYRNEAEDEVLNTLIKRYSLNKSASDYVKRYDNKTFDEKIWQQYIPVEADNKKLESAGEKAADSIAKGAKKGTKKTKDAGKALGEALNEGAKEATDEHSPSETARQIGLYYTQGLALGVKDGIPLLVDSIRQALEAGEITQKDVDELLAHVSKYSDRTDLTFGSIKKDEQLKAVAGQLSHAHFFEALQYQESDIDNAFNDIVKVYQQRNKFLTDLNKANFGGFAENTLKEYLEKAEADIKEFQDKFGSLLSNEQLEKLNNYDKQKQVLLDFGIDKDFDKTFRDKINEYKQLRKDYADAVRGEIKGDNLTEDQLSLFGDGDKSFANQRANLESWLEFFREIDDYASEVNSELKKTVELEEQLNIEVRDGAIDNQNKQAINSYNNLGKKIKEIITLMINSKDEKSFTETEKERLEELIELWHKAINAEDEYAVVEGGTESVNKNAQTARDQFLKGGWSSYIDDARTELTKLETGLNRILNNSGKYTTEYLIAINEQLEKVKLAKENLPKFEVTNLEDLDKLVSIVTEVKTKSEDLFNAKQNNEYMAANIRTLEKYRGKVAKVLNENTRMPKELREQFLQLAHELDNFDFLTGTREQALQLTTTFEHLNAELIRTNKLGLNIFDRFKKELASTNARLIAQFFSFYDIIRYTRQIVGTVRDLDTALVDLRKTTSMTATELDEFYFSSNKIAQQMGVTTQEIIQQAANWSRLGYSTKEASEQMAALSSQFAAISPGMDVSTATDGLVSAMKAFHVEVDSVESDLMDPINRLGNTMATTNEEIVNMLERSSAAMYAANNSIQETLALESAAVQITRNAENTGTAFRTISMRIRGYDEETEELSEEYENLSGKIADLTKTAKTPGGISLFTDKDKQTFKSTYQLLKDISEIWDDLTDKQQAQLLEKLAGKRGGQVLSGILGKENFAEVERAMGEILQSAGSADAEMEIIQDSIEYKINAIKQSWVGFLQEAIKRDDVKELFDALVTGSESLQKSLISITPALTELIKLLTQLLETFAKVNDSTGGLAGIAGLLFGFSKAKGIGKGFGKKLGTELLALKDSFKKPAFSVAQASAMESEALLAAAQDYEMNADVYSRMAFGMSLDEVKAFKTEVPKATSSFKNLFKVTGEGTGAFGKFAAKLGLSSAGLAAFIAVIGATVYSIYKLEKAQKEIIEQAKEAQKVFSDQADSIEDYREKALEYQSIANNNTKSIEEQQEARENLLSLQQQMVDEFGVEAAQIDILTDSIDRLNRGFDALAEKHYQEFLNSVNRNEGWDGFWHKIHTGEMFDSSITNWSDIKEQMEHAHFDAGINKLDVDNISEILTNEFKKEGLDVKYDTYSDSLVGDNNLKNYYEALLNIQRRYAEKTDEDSQKIANHLTKYANEVGDTLKAIEGTYNSVLEHDVINKSYRKEVNELSRLKEELRQAQIEGNEESVKKITQKLINAYNEVIKKANGNEEIENWFSDFVAEVQGLMDEQTFVAKIQPELNTELSQEFNAKKKQVANSTDPHMYEDEVIATAESGLTEDEIKAKYGQDYAEIISWIRRIAAEEKVPISLVVEKLEVPNKARKDLEERLNKVDKKVLNNLSEEEIEYLQKLEPYELSIINSTEQLTAALKRLHEVQNQKWSKTEMIDNLTEMADGFDKIDEIYADVFDKGSFDFSKLNTKKFQEAFGDLGLDYEQFIETVSGHTDDIKYCQDAFNDLIDTFIRSSGILDNVTKENASLTKSMLEMYGVTNADILVTEALQKAEAEDWLAKKDLSNITPELAKKLGDEAEQAGLSRQAVYELMLAEIDLNNTELDLSDVVSQIESVAIAAGIAKGEIANLGSMDRNGDGKSGTLFDPYAHGGGFESYTDANGKKVNGGGVANLMQQVRDKIKAQYKSPTKAEYGGGDKTKDAKDKAAKDAEKDKELFDWIETKIQRVEREITNLGKIADATYRTWGERTVALGEEMEKVTEQIGLQQTAYETYMKQAEAFDLSKDYKDKVINGALAIDEVTDDVLKKKIKDFKEIYEKALAAQDKIEDLRSSLANLAKAKLDNITSQFDDMISDIDHYVKYINAQLSSVETIGKIGGKSFYEALIAQEQQRVVELTDELAQLQNALAEGLASGAIAYGSQMWAEMKKSIYSVEEAIWDANNAILEFQEKLKQVAKQNFDDLVSQFENAINILTSKMDLTDKIIGMVQNTGHIVSKEYYKSLIEASDQNVKNLKKKYEELSKVFQEAVANGDIKEYSDEWYEMREKIEAVKGEIIDAANALIEYKNALRQIEWDLFDRAQTRLEQLVSESQFLIDLYSKYPLFDKKTGEITDKGIATRGLLVQNYETYRQQAAQLAAEIAKLKEELAADPGSTTLIDRIKELEQAERDAILASEGIKESLRDLLQNEIDALLDALQKLIDKYKKSLQAQKDLHDFQKNIEEQNRNINNLRKQLMAYDNGSDTTEENRARVQKLNEQLKQAEDQLQETEWDRYISETTQLLDDFMESLKEYFDEKLLDLNWVLEQAIEATNLNADAIKETIDRTAEETGYTFTDEFTKIWENMTASDSLFSEQRDILSATGQVCTDIKAGVDLLPTMDGLSAYLDGETLAIVSEIASVDNAVSNVQSAIGETNAALAQIQSRIQEYNASVLQAMASAQAAAEKAQQAAQQAQRTADEAKNKASQGGGNNPGSGDNNNPGNSNGGTGYVVKIWTTDNRGYGPYSLHVKSSTGAEKVVMTTYDLDQLKRIKAGYNLGTPLGFAKGGVISKYDNPLDILAQSLGEDHMVAAKEGERILTAKQNENFEKLANAFSSLSSEDMAKYSIFTGNKMIGKMPTLQMPTLRDMNAGNSTEINGGISINLPNVTNKAEFVEWLKTDGQIEKIVQSMTLGKLQGRNSYDKMKY